MKRKNIYIGIIILLVIVIIVAISITNNRPNIEDAKLVFISQIEDDQSTKENSDSLHENTKAVDDIGQIVKSLAKVSITGKYNKKDGTISCEITSPDIYSYVMENIDLINNQTDEETFSFIKSYLDSGEYKVRSSEVIAKAMYKDGVLVIDDTSYVFQDALHGGANSLLTDLMILTLDGIEEKRGNRDEE